ncbi:TIGR00266 family protein [Alkaliphilus peptidifermentans]|uniref:TIGR00266 family protein n=1 Tax=Alkaliphilus peptidifermentans DSM 18978 TaxID=1120976 RepID=A0A1G5JKJ1_9FIRM|nr:TIGR00266 family protein [Alkaliphilus peptidifermentans]SCY88885.1 TIGR00266 family protein [Alkaliphilus peptidifermentans DSM 18978]
MEYKIVGTTMPLVELTLKRGDVIKSQAGAMKWMDSQVQMKTSMDGGVGGFFKRKLMGESGFLNFFEAERDGDRIAFGHTFPGYIIPIEVDHRSIICQKRSFLCSTMDVEVEIAFQRKLGSGFFGGEGFIMQELKGSGIAFVEIDGESIELELKPGESIKVETGAVGMYESTVSMNVEMVKGFSNILFGGEGLFLTTLTGPGKVWIQTMPISSMAGELFPYLPKPSSR